MSDTKTEPKPELVDVTEKPPWDLDRLPPPGPFNAVCTFPKPPAAASSYILDAVPQMPFKPQALLFWGATEDTFVTSLRIGTQLQGYVNVDGDIPGEFFSTAKSYEKLIEDFAAHGVAPPSWITFETVRVGVRISIHLRGPLRAALMLGKAVR